MAFFSPLVTSSLISAGSSLLGGALGASSSAKQNKKQMELQKEFAQKGVQWRVADAKAAGLHPLAAMGLQGSTYSPAFQTNPMGDALAQAGQSIANGVRDNRISPVERSIINKNNAEADFARASAAASLQARANQTQNSPVSSVSVAEPENTHLRLNEHTVVPVSKISDAEAFENRYGDIAQEAAGLVILGSDIAGNVLTSKWADDVVDRSIHRRDNRRLLGVRRGNRYLRSPKAIPYKKFQTRKDRRKW